MSTGKRQRSKDTAAELAVQQALYDIGLRNWVKHSTVSLPAWGGKSQRTTPDILFRAEKLAVFVDGCMWHMCPEHFSMFKTNTAYWRRKGAQQRARDQRHSRCLETLGYRVLRTWEHEDPGAAAVAIKAILDTDAAPGTYGIPE